MRELKFRAWIKEGFDEEYSPYMTEVVRIDWGREYIYDEDFEQYFFNQMKLLQYTGLKDKKGKEIYEGDILHIAGSGNLPVTYKNGGYGFYDGEFMLYIYEDFEDDITLEVIGNKYENPELITPQDE